MRKFGFWVFWGFDRRFFITSHISSSSSSSRYMCIIPGFPRCPCAHIYIYIYLYIYVWLKHGDLNDCIPIFWGRFGTMQIYRLNNGDALWFINQILPKRIMIWNCNRSINNSIGKRIGLIDKRCAPLFSLDVRTLVNQAPKMDRSNCLAHR